MPLILSWMPLLIVNPSGLIVLDSSSPLDIENPSTIPNFSPTVTGKFLLYCRQFLRYVR